MSDQLRARGPETRKGSNSSDNQLSKERTYKYLHEIIEKDCRERQKRENGRKESEKREEARKREEKHYC